MPKPWEKYAATAPAAAGPWAKYGPGGGSAVPDFSTARGDVRIPDSARIPEPREPERLVDSIPTAGPASRILLETGEDFARAAGHHAMKPLHGAAQAIEHGVGWIADQVLPENIAGRLREVIAADDAALRANEAAYQAQVPDSPGANTGAVVGAVAPFLLSGGRLGGTQAGNITGRLGATIGPRAERLARAVGFGTTEGAVGAATAPVLGDDFAGEKLDQVGVGALAGGGLPIAGQALSAAGNLARPILRMGDRFTQSGARREAAEQIRKVATDPGKVATTVAPSRVADSRRTLATESLDPGVAALEDLARQTDGSFAAIDRANNEARVAAIKPFAGDDVAIETAERARDAAADPFRKAALKGTGVDTSRLVAEIDDGVEKLRGFPDVQKALVDARALLFRPTTAAERALKPDVDAVPEDAVRNLYNARKQLNAWIGGKFGADKSHLATAQRELMIIRNALDRAISRTSPEFEQYLNAFRDGSRGVDRLKLGRELLEGGAGKASPDPITGSPTLTPEAFGKQTSTARRLDKTAQTATGFRKARAGNIASPGMMTAIADVGDDLRRVAKVGGMLSSNSRTAARQKLDETLAEGAVGAILAKLPLVGGMVGTVNRKGGERVREQLVFLLQNPEEARAALRALPPADAAVLRDVLARLSGAAGAAAGNAAEVEVDVVGGTPAPRDEVARNIERYAR